MNRDIYKEEKITTQEKQFKCTEKIRTNGRKFAQSGYHEHGRGLNFTSGRFSDSKFRSSAMLL
jgi:hypothetical protein